MRAGWWLCGLLVAMPAAADDLAEMNAVSKTWDRYVELSSADKRESVDLLSASSLVHFGFLRDAALYASAEQLRRIPATDRITVYLLRASQIEAKLKSLDNRAVAELCVSSGWTGMDRAGDDAPASLSHVTLVGDYAVGEVAPPTESQFQFGPDFDREGSVWKFRYESLVPDTSMAVDESIRNSGATATQMYQMVVANILKSPSAPSLAVLDRPLLDDAVARVRLNESWPEYDNVYGRRVAAVAQKAKDGDSFAQYVYGAWQLSGDLRRYVPRNETAGLELLEKASDNGNANAAEGVAAYLMSDPRALDDARLRRVTRHLQRAADAGKPESMSTLGTFYFEGAGGLARDCRRAAEWQARAEEAGSRGARNDLVWTWATCPQRDQRDPAKALDLAQHLIKQQDELGASELDTVAAAFAANGQFEQAVDFQQKAIDSINAEFEDKKARTNTLKRMQARLAGYKKGRDYVQDYNTFAEMRAGRY